ncbi:GNAT family N-acetyltransferase [Fodinibius sp.]|uniref:GNAT family N-acetyltransferase n=1 Tax=Fodinibius sp. TaxID=1872440 RepID=UPI002ACD8E0C|nr:GNAT family N-acetyltransferase [Fodinibius sp.]MDZ7660279.1 GNAT family N-acetyltransferase [Fodinibius sp.]
MEIRLYKKGDIEQVAHLLGDSVSILNAEGYPETEKSSFALNNIQYTDWEETCLTNFTVVAEINNSIVGIGQINYGGHINCFYCHPDYRGQGIGKQLYTALEEYATAKDISTIHTETNALDRPFYFKMGFSTVQKQRVLLNGEIESNFVVQKQLST